MITYRTIHTFGNFRITSILCIAVYKITERSKLLPLLQMCNLKLLRSSDIRGVGVEFTNNGPSLSLLFSSSYCLSLNNYLLFPSLNSMAGNFVFCVAFALWSRTKCSSRSPVVITQGFISVIGIRVTSTLFRSQAHFPRYPVLGIKLGIQLLWYPVDITVPCVPKRT